MYNLHIHAAASVSLYHYIIIVHSYEMPSAKYLYILTDYNYLVHNVVPQNYD